MPIFHNSYRQDLVPRAKELRHPMTPQERRLWYCFLREYPVKFYRQRPIDSFIVDFYCASAKLVIELDVSQHYIDQGTAYDQERTAILENKYGLRVVRFSNYEINVNFQTVCEQIHYLVSRRLPKEVSSP